MPTPKPKKMGRPVLPEGHAKSSKVQVRLTEDDIRQIGFAAEITNQSVSEWIRSTVTAEYKRVLGEANKNGSRNAEPRKIRREAREAGIRGGRRG